nr:unnamed protein product [Digitaria exilis]
MPSTTSDLKNTIEKTLGGAGVALSSPRLVLPGMMGFLAYKAAALVQVYRDNEDLRLILPEEEDADSHSA